MQELSYTRDEAAGVALLAEAVAQGHRSPASRSLTSFALTSSQAELLRRALAWSPPSHWLVDADHSKVCFAEDWAGLQPAPLGTLGLTVPEAVEVPSTSRLVVRLPEPRGEAVFGTGRHTATQLASELLEDHLGPEAEVWDVGTGSGILAVYALRLGASQVWATDTQPTAVEAARRAAVLNGVSDRLDVAPAHPQPSISPRDLIVANILPGVLIDVMPHLAASLKADGKLLTSGVVVARAADVEAAAVEAGCRHLETRTRDGWAALAFQRNVG